MQFTIEVTDAANLAGLQRALAQYNSMNEPKTEAAFLQWQVDNQLSEYARTLVQPVITKLAFLNRFAAEERIGIRAAAAQSPAIADYLAMLDAAQDVDLTDARTIGGANALEAAGLIGEGRAAAILAL
jgi:hypothetical protein